MFAVVRVRGKVGVKREFEDTLKLLRLRAVNNCVVVPENPSFRGMLEKVKDYVTWGEIDKKTLIELLRRRLRLKGGRRVDEHTLKEVTGYESFEKLAEDLLEGKVKLKEFEQLEPVFRLSPPSKGYKSIKFPYPKGDLGYRGKAINELLERMV